MIVEQNVASTVIKLNETERGLLKNSVDALVLAVHDAVKDGAESVGGHLEFLTVLSEKLAPLADVVDSLPVEDEDGEEFAAPV